MEADGTKYLCPMSDRGTFVPDCSIGFPLYIM